MRDRLKKEQKERDRHKLLRQQQKNENLSYEFKPLINSKSNFYVITASNLLETLLLWKLRYRFAFFAPRFRVQASIGSVGKNQRLPGKAFKSITL